MRQPEPIEHRIVYNPSRIIVCSYDYYGVTEFGISRQRMCHISAEN